MKHATTLPHATKGGYTQLKANPSGKVKSSVGRGSRKALSLRRVCCNVFVFLLIRLYNMPLEGEVHTLSIFPSVRKVNEERPFTLLLSLLLYSVNLPLYGMIFNAFFNSPRNLLINSKI